MKSSKLINSFIRRFSDYIALNSNLYLSHKPDLHTKLNKVENWDSLYRFWIKNSPRNDKGDLVRLYFLLNQIEYIKNNNIPGLIAEVGFLKEQQLVFFIKLFLIRRFYYLIILKVLISETLIIKKKIARRILHLKQCLIHH